MAEPTRMAAKMIAEIDEAELVVRLLEIGCEMKRPDGVSGREALAQIRQAAESDPVQAKMENERLRDALFWCGGGSPDFQEGGIAQEGWDRHCAPLLESAD